MNRLVVLYPAAWRNRYGDEFDAMLVSRPPSIGERLDIVRGAVDAHVHPQLPGRERLPDRAGIGPLVGFAALVGAVLLSANGPVQFDEYGTYRDGSAALPAFIIAMLLLDVGLYRVLERLPDEAGWARAAGTIAIVAGLTWAVMPWVTPIGLAFILGVLGLAVGARRAGILPAWSLILLAGSLAVPAGVFAATPFLPWFAFRVSGLDYLTILGPLAVLWLVIGGLLLRGFPRAAPTSDAVGADGSTG